MTTGRCLIPFCAAQATGVWEWDVGGTRVAGMKLPMCDLHRRQKARSRTPGTFTEYPAQPTPTGQDGT